MRSDVSRPILALALGLVPLSVAAGTPQADLRVAMVRINEHLSDITLAGGEADELQVGETGFEDEMCADRELDGVGAEQQLVDLQAANAELEGEIAKLQSPVEIERIAREQFGLVRPGETGYVVEVPEPAPVLADETDQADQTGAPSGFWQGIWDFLTGRDLERDG